jgi:hypothetical protein
MTALPPTINPNSALGRLSVMQIQDITGHSLGMVAENKDRSAYVNQFLIPRNSKIPATEKRAVELRVPAAGGETEVYMLQGEVPDCPWNSDVLGKYVLSGIQPENSQNTARVEISYAYNANSRVDVSGFQPKFGQKLQLRKEPVPEDMSWLRESPGDVEKRNRPRSGVVLVIDASASMRDGVRMQEAEKAAGALVKTLDTERFSIGVVAFGSSVVTHLPMTNDIGAVKNCIGRFCTFSLGGTDGS